MANLTNDNYERLVEQITDLVLSRLDDGGAGGGSYCPSFCGADVQRIVDAGASRIGIVLGETATAHDWASLIDHTLLKPEASEADIKRLCNEAVQYGFASVCVNPAWVKKAAEFLRGTSVPVCTVIGFPLGATLPDVKAYERRRDRSRRSADAARRRSRFGRQSLRRRQGNRRREKNGRSRSDAHRRFGRRQHRAGSKRREIFDCGGKLLKNRN